MKPRRSANDSRAVWKMEENVFAACSVEVVELRCRRDVDVDGAAVSPSSRDPASSASEGRGSRPAAANLPSHGQSAS